jgi:hypothetical protein
MVVPLSMTDQEAKCLGRICQPEPTSPQIKLNLSAPALVSFPQPSKQKNQYRRKPGVLPRRVAGEGKTGEASIRKLLFGGLHGRCNSTTEAHDNRRAFGSVEGPALLAPGFAFAAARE